jgi:excisionase family DNA binding protein
MKIVEKKIPQLLSIDDVCKIMKVSQSSVRRWIKDRSLNTIRIGKGIVRIREDELRNFLYRDSEESESAGNIGVRTQSGAHEGGTGDDDRPR